MWDARKITVKEVLSLAHFEMGLVALTSTVVNCQCCQIFIEKTQQTRTSTKTPKCFVFYNSKKILYLISATDHFLKSIKCLALWAKTKTTCLKVGVDRYVFFRADADTDYYRPSRPITDILDQYMSGVKIKMNVKLRITRALTKTAFPGVGCTSYSCLPPCIHLQ